MFELLTINEKDYQLKLTARTTVLLEKKLKRNPLILFMQMEQGHMVTLEDVLTMFYCSLVKFHGEEIKTEDDAYDLYDTYIEEGGSMIDLLDVISNVVVNAGYMKKEEAVETAEKN